MATQVQPALSGTQTPIVPVQPVDQAEIERIHALVLDLPHIDRREQVCIGSTHDLCSPGIIGIIETSGIIPRSCTYSLELVWHGRCSTPGNCFHLPPASPTNSLGGSIQQGV